MYSIHFFSNLLFIAVIFFKTNAIQIKLTFMVFCSSAVLNLWRRNAVMERKMFSAERNIRWLCASPVTSFKQSNSAIVFWFCSAVKFFSSILLDCKYVQVGALKNSFRCHYKRNVYHLNRSANKLARWIHIILGPSWVFITSGLFKKNKLKNLKMSCRVLFFFLSKAAIRLTGITY